MKLVEFSELIGKTLETANYHIPNEVLTLKTACGKTYQISSANSYLYEGIQDLILTMREVISEAYVTKDENYTFCNIKTSNTHVRLWWIGTSASGCLLKFYELSDE